MARRVNLRFGEQVSNPIDLLIPVSDAFALSDDAALTVSTGAVAATDTMSLKDTAATTLTAGGGTHFTLPESDLMGLGDVTIIAASLHQTVTVTDTTGLKDAASENISSPAGATMLGISATPDSPHGNITNWDGYRAYSLSTMNNLANGTVGQARPKFFMYSESANPLSGTYASIKAHVISVLDTFYYNGTGQTHSARWGIKVFWSNGNENYKPAKIPDVPTYVTSMQALYDAIHTIDPLTGQRRYPDAYAGSNPTTNQEQAGTVQTALHASARYHDFVAWSMYPIDLGNDGDVITYDWPSFNEPDRTNGKTGFLLRPFYRTKQAELVVRTGSDGGTPIPGFRMMIGCGETGNTRSPGDITLRPYWTVNAMYRGAKVLSVQYDLDMPFLCWWDDGGGIYPYGGTTTQKAGHLVSGRSTDFGTDDATGPNSHPANPTSAQAWFNAAAWCDSLGGTKPAAWAANPKIGTWNTSGPVV